MQGEIVWPFSLAMAKRMTGGIDRGGMGGEDVTQKRKVTDLFAIISKPAWKEVADN